MIDTYKIRPKKDKATWLPPYLRFEPELPFEKYISKIYNSNSNTNTIYIKIYTYAK